ncbi:MAG: hypothetical protein KatS3mg113_0538 [Planctomycetaceae bacterium]|nr:MAG: hypothetical protein KatS3mg113_0538 [Planctomycetaceae bacterium]
MNLPVLRVHQSDTKTVWTRWLGATLMAVGCWFDLQTTWAQGGATAAQANTLTGRVLSCDTSGKIPKLVLETGEGEIAVELTPRVDWEVTAAASDDCFLPGLLVQIEAIESNRMYFGSQFILSRPSPGRPSPQGIVPAPAEAGQSRNRYFLRGEIIAYQAAGENEIRDRLLIKVGGSQVLVHIDENHKVTATLRDVSLIEPGQNVSLVGRKTGMKWIPQKIVIESAQAITAAQLQPPTAPGKKTANKKL